MTIKPIPGVPESEFSEQFVNGMYNRMGMSFFKYGAVADAYPTRINALESLQLRLRKYQESGNTEFLIDAANFAMIEFMHPSLAGARFEATDSDKSPGRVWAHGSVSQDPNVARYAYRNNGD